MTATAWTVIAYIVASLLAAEFLLANSKRAGSWILGVVWPVLLLVIAAMWLVTRFVPEPEP